MSSESQKDNVANNCLPTDQYGNAGCSQGDDPTNGAGSGSSLSTEDVKVVFMPKPVFPNLTKEEKKRLKEKIWNRMREIYPYCELGKEYKRFYPPLPTPRQSNNDPLPRSFLMEEESGVISSFVIRPAVLRPVIEKAVAQGRSNLTLLSGPTPSFLEVIGKKLLEDMSRDQLASAGAQTNPGKQTPQKEPVPSTSEQCRNDLLEKSRDSIAKSQQASEVIVKLNPPPSTAAANKTGTHDDHLPSTTGKSNEETKGVAGPQSPVSFSEMCQMSMEQRQQMDVGNIIRQAIRAAEKKVAEEEEAEKKAKAEKKKAAVEARRKRDEEERAALILTGSRRRSSRRWSDSGWTPQQDTSDGGGVNLNFISATENPFQPNFVAVPPLPSNPCEGNVFEEKQATSAPQEVQDNMTPPLPSTSVPRRRSQGRRKLSREVVAPIPKEIDSASRRPGVLATTTDSSTAEYACALTVTNSMVTTPRAGCPLDNDTGWVEKDLWEIEDIVDSKIETNENSVEMKMYKVKWKGWEKIYNSWINESDFMCTFKLGVYWRRIRKRIKLLNQAIAVIASQVEPKSPTYFLF